MPCGQGWVENTTLTFEGTTFTDQAILVDALVAMGFTSQQIEVSDGRIRVAARHFYGYGDLVFKRVPKGMEATYVQEDLGLLNEKRLNPRGFFVGLKTAYNTLVVQKLAKRLHGTFSQGQKGNVLKLTVRVG